MSKKFKTQDEIDINHALGTLRQLAFFEALEGLGMTPNACTEMLSSELLISRSEALRILYCIGRKHDSDGPMPTDLKKYLIEKGRAFLN